MQNKYDSEKKETLYDKTNITVGMLNIVITAGILLMAVLVGWAIFL